MFPLAELAPWLIAMGVLIGLSGFFSSSEAALFSLRGKERQKMLHGGVGERLAAGLLLDPDRLLSAVLFWNLVVNVTYFAITSIATLRVDDAYPGHAQAVAFSVGALLTIILLGEMVPKSLAVLAPRKLAAAIAVPLALAVRTLDPVMPVLTAVNLLSRRLIWPGFEPEPYLEVADLERAIELSTDDANLIEHEQAVLRNIVSLSDIRADECMRPRMQFMVFRPPVRLADLGGRMTPSGYLLITDPEGHDVVSALHLSRLANIPDSHLEHFAEPVAFVPWCATAADTLEDLWKSDREVAAVVNERGEVIGIVTREDLLDTVFTNNPARSERLLNRQSIEPVREGVWRVNGMTSLRRIARQFEIDLPATKSKTIGGVLQEELQRLPRPDDRLTWGPFELRVVEAPQRGPILAELTLAQQEEESP